MADLEALEKIAERLEKGEVGPEIDKIIMAALGWCLHPMERWRDDSCQSDRGYTCLDCGADSWGNRSKNGWEQRFHDAPPEVSTSLDACEALHKRLLPGWQWGASSNPPDDIFAGGCVQAFVVKDLWTHEGYAHAEAPTEPAARTAAILRAFIAQERAKQEGKTDDR